MAIEFAQRMLPSGHPYVPACDFFSRIDCRDLTLSVLWRWCNSLVLSTPNQGSAQ